MALKPYRLEASRGARRNAALAFVLVSAALLIGWPKNTAAVTVIDPQTLLLGQGKKVRLFDIATPKSVQCGCVAECFLAQRAIDFLQKTISQADSDIRIKSFGFDPDGAMRAKVFVNSRDLSMLMIQNGFARVAIMGSAAQWCTQ
jgi:endonuclease YncB( thermonuclease family)